MQSIWQLLFVSDLVHISNHFYIVPIYPFLYLRINAMKSGIQGQAVSKSMLSPLGGIIQFNSK